MKNLKINFQLFWFTAKNLWTFQMSINNSILIISIKIKYAFDENFKYLQRLLVFE